MLKVDDKFFHGISFSNWEFVPGNFNYLILLEMILKDGKILTRDSLGNMHNDVYRCLYNYSYNGIDRVSISCHPSQYNNYTNYLSNYYNRRIDDAFDGFVSNYFSIILKEDVLDDYFYDKAGCFGEYQIYGDISLKDMVGLGVPNFFERMCSEVGVILKLDNFKFYKNNYYVDKLRCISDILKFLEYGYCNIGYYEYERVKELLSKYNYDVPVVDSVTGFEWCTKEEMMERIEDTKKLACSKKLI